MPANERPSELRSNTIVTAPLVLFTFQSSRLADGCLAPLKYSMLIGNATSSSPPIANSENPDIAVLDRTGAVLEPVVVTCVPFNTQSPPAEGRLINTVLV